MKNKVQQIGINFVYVSHRLTPATKILYILITNIDPLWCIMLELILLHLQNALFPELKETFAL